MILFLALTLRKRSVIDIMNSTLSLLQHAAHTSLERTFLGAVGAAYSMGFRFEAS
jgi:hypothetical protein